MYKKIGSQENREPISGPTIKWCFILPNVVKKLTEDILKNWRALIVWLAIAFFQLSWV